MRVRAADVAVERQTSGISGSLRGSHGHTEDGVSAEVLLVVGAVDLDHGGVQHALIVSLDAGDRVGDGLVDVAHGVAHALALVAVVAVAQLVRLVLAGGRAGRDGGQAVGTVVEEDLDLDGRVTAGIQDFTGVRQHDVSH